MNPPGDLKLYGRAVAVDDLERRAAYRAALKARIGWEPEEPEFHLFAIEVESAVYVRFDEEVQEHWRWATESGLVKRVRPNG
jgi:hypothetical protein